MKHKISISTQKLQQIYGDKKALEIAKKLGVDGVDFFTNSFDFSKSDSVYSRSDQEIIEYFSDIKKYADSLGISVAQTHGRLRTYMGEEASDKKCLENARRDLLAASALGAPVCVMHGVKSSIMKGNPEPRYIRDLCYEIFSRIIEWSRMYGVKTAIETSGYTDATQSLEFFANAKEIKGIFERISKQNDNSQYFSICVDTGHTNTAVRFGNPSVGDCIRMYGKGISCLHLHDNDGVHDLHLPMRCGTIDWEDVLSALKEIGYDGYYNLEVNFSRFGKGFEIEAADFSVKLLRFMLDLNK